MAFRTVCKVSDIPVGQGKAFTVDGNKQLALFHLEDGFYATQRRCPHLFTPWKKEPSKWPGALPHAPRRI